MPVPGSAEVRPDVSVVMSTFNRADVLPAAISRLLSQDTRVRYEVIVVDNNSRDQTPAVLRDAERRDGRLRAAFEPRQGVSYGRNRGIELSRAPIVAFTDDDVWVTPAWVQTIFDTLGSRPDVDCVGGRVLPVWRSKPPDWVTRRHWSPLALVDYGDQPFVVDSSRPVCLVTANVAYRRSALDAVGWFSGDFPRCQDHELLLRFWSSGRRGLYIPALTVQCEVPASRLNWAYHRRWHSDHGRFSALMPDAVLGPSAAGDDPRGALTLFGSPGSVYRQLFSSARALAVARLTGRRRAALDAEVTVRHRAAFIAARARLWRRHRRSAIGEISRFIGRWVGKRRVQTDPLTPRT